MEPTWESPRRKLKSKCHLKAISQFLSQSKLTFTTPTTVPSQCLFRVPLTIAFTRWLKTKSTLTTWINKSKKTATFWNITLTVLDVWMTLYMSSQDQWHKINTRRSISSYVTSAIRFRKLKQILKRMKKTKSSFSALITYPK